MSDTAWPVGDSRYDIESTEWVRCVMPTAMARKDGCDDVQQSKFGFD